MKKNLLLPLILFMVSVWFINAGAMDYAIKSDKIESIPDLFTAEELNWIYRNRDREFIVGAAQDYIPIEYINEKDVPKGMGIELLRKVNELTGLKFRLYDKNRDATWQDIMDNIENGTIDILSTVSYTEDRSGYITFSIPYMEMTQVIIGSGSNKNLVKDILQASENSFAVPSGYWFESILLNANPNADLIDAKNMQEALGMVNRGQADFTICELPVYTYYDELGRYKNIKIAGELKDKNGIYIGARKELSAIIPIINKVITNTNSYELYEKAMVMPEDSRRLILMGTLAGFLFFSVLLLVIYLIQTFHRLIESKKQAEAAYKDKIRLISNISHDLRTPITALIGYTQALLDNKVSTAEDKQKYLYRLSIKVKYLNAMVDDFFLLARMEEDRLSLNREAVDLEALVKQILPDTELKAREKGIQISLSVLKKGLAVYADSVKLSRVLDNILANALCFTGGGGSIEVVLEPWESGARIGIKDTGAGMEEEEIPHIFERYYKGRNARKESNGLGLFIAKTIVEKHGGRIWAESIPGKGSSFFITLK